MVQTNRPEVPSEAAEASPTETHAPNVTIPADLLRRLMHYAAQINRLYDDDLGGSYLLEYQEDHDYGLAWNALEQQVPEWHNQTGGWWLTEDAECPYAGEHPTACATYWKQSVPPSVARSIRPFHETVGMSKDGRLVLSLPPGPASLAQIIGEEVTR